MYATIRKFFKTKFSPFDKNSPLENKYYALKLLELYKTYKSLNYISDNYNLVKCGGFFKVSDKKIFQLPSIISRSN